MCRESLESPGRASTPRRRVTVKASQFTKKAGSALLTNLPGPQAARSFAGFTPVPSPWVAPPFTDGRPLGYHTSHVLYPPERL